MSPDLQFNVGMYIVGGFVFVGINAFVVGRYVSGLATKEELKEKVKERDTKIEKSEQSVAQKFKETGEWVNRDFVRIGMCNQAHAFMDRESLRKEEDSKAFRIEIKESILKLQTQFESFQREVFERLPKKE